MLPVRAALYSGLAVAGAVAVLLVTRRPADPLDNPAYDALSRAHSRKLVAQAAALDSARTTVLKDSARVVQSAARFVKVRDSVFVPVTHTDTVEVLAKLPAFLAATDSLQQSCSTLTVSCADYRVKAESTISGLTLDRNLWKGVAESERPSRWEPLKQWAIRGILVYGAFRLGEAVR